MRISTTLLTFTGLVSHITAAAYTLQDDYSTESFFSMFDFFTADDPTHGYVNYVDSSTATSSGLAGTKNGQIYMGVDTTNVASGRGRNSVRITSKKSYNAGSLIVLDLAHMPRSICGTWPAFWTVGPSWPSNGEIDIIEGVNTQAYNHYALHTGSGCSISNTGMFSGSIETQSCDVNAAGQPNNAGCSIVTSDTSSYGDGLNAGQGGVYATEFTSSAISIWFFSRSAIPADIASGSPKPSGWGKPHASFGSPCNIGQFVKQQQIVFDTTFCGDWASGVWSTDATCSAKASTCQEFVQNNPSAFKESYWSINSLRVYSGSGSGGGQPGGPGSASQKPTISGALPTASGAPGHQPPLSSAPGGGFPKSSFAAQAPAPAPSAEQGNLPQGPPQPQPQQGQPPQGWGGDNQWDNGRVVSAWDGGQWGQPKSPAVAPAAAATGAAPPTANTNVNGNMDTAAAPPPAPAPQAPQAPQAPNPPSAPAPAPQASQAPEPPSVSASPSRPWGGSSPPWKRPSWLRRYETVSAMSNDDFRRFQVAADGTAADNHKRAVEEEEARQVEEEVEEEDSSLEEQTALAFASDNRREIEARERRDIEEAEALRRRGEKESRYLNEHLHRHVGMRKRGWWSS